MAYNKGSELQNNINSLSKLVLVLKVCKFFFYFYAFISFFFWFLNCFEVGWLDIFSWAFIVPFSVVNMFYRPSGIGADFSLAIIGVLSLLVGLAIEFLSNQLYMQISSMQEELEKYLEQKKTVKPKRARPMPVDRVKMSGASAVKDISDIYEDKFFLLYIIQPHVHKIRNNENDMELTFQEADIWRQRVNKRILGNIHYSQPMQKGYYRKNLFLVYKDFNYSDDFVYYIQPTIESIIYEFQRYGIEVRFNHVLSSVSQLSNVEKELDLMDTILSLNFENMFILTNNFKTAYDIKSIKKYELVLKGEYNLSKNLSKSNIQPLYMFKNEGTSKKNGK